VEVPEAARQIALWMQQEREEEEHEHRYIRASSISFCRRRIAYSLLGYQPAPSGGHALFTFSTGHALHMMLQRRLVGMGWIKARLSLSPHGSPIWEQDGDPLSGCELEILDHDQRVIGHLDGLTVPLKKGTGPSGLPGYYPDPEGERYLVEIKTITDRPRFWVLGIRDGGVQPVREEDAPPEFLQPDVKLSLSGDLQQQLGVFSHTREVIAPGGLVMRRPVYRMQVRGSEELVTLLRAGTSRGSFSNLRAPKPEHVLQATVYAAHYEIRKVLFIYAGKDADRREYADEEDLLNVPLKVFEHSITREDVATVRERVQYVYRYTDAGDLPPRDFDFDAKRSPCPYCPFAWQCWPERIEINPLNEQLDRLGLKPLVPGPRLVSSE
jgi:hypothetical protein